MNRVVIIGACRTAGGKFGGTLKSIPATDLGAAVIKEAVVRSGIPGEKIEEVIMGNGWQAGVGPNPARIAAWRTEVARNALALTINKRCGSGLEAVMLLADRIRLGERKAGIAGGMESTSSVPYVLPEARWGYTMGEKKLPDLLHRDGFFCPLADMLMGETAEILAGDYSISREEQDRFALESHRKAVRAVDSGCFKEEIVPIKVKQKKEEILFDTDEIPRRETSLEKLSRLPPVFREKGTVTAGNSSALCNAASAVVLADKEWAEANGYTSMAEISGYAGATTEPDRMGLCPVYSTPIGATGAKIFTTLLYSLRREAKEHGLVTACIGGGQGISMVIKRLF